MKTLKILALSALFSLAQMALTNAAAHATVRTDAGTSESLVGKYETYRLQVPVEKELATTQIKLIIPKGVSIGTFMQTPGWQRSLERDASGALLSVTWKGTLEPMEFVRFLFSMRNPAEATELKWAVYQTYADGTVVAWDDSSDKTPASKIKIVAALTPVPMPAPTPAPAPK